MLAWLRTLILYRLLGGRAVLTLAALGWLWRRLRGGGSPDGGASASRRYRGR